MDIISKVFDEAIMPYILDAGKTVLKITVVQGAYYMMRSDRKNGIDKVKYGATGYVMLRCVDLFIGVVDEIANTIR